MWASYATGRRRDKLGGRPTSPTRRRDKLWKLVDALDIPTRKKGKKDDDDGYVTLRLREPGDDEPSTTSIRSTCRATREDDDVIALATYLRELVEKYYKEKPNF